MLIQTRTVRARVVLQVVVTALVVPFALPLYWMVQYSLTGSGWGNYQAVLDNPSLPLFFRNSAIISAACIVITLTCTLLAAYALGKLHVRFREGFFYILLGAMTMPTAALALPLFMTIEHLHLFNTYWAVILPVCALSIPFNVLLARSYVAGLPDELLDAARVDGCTSFGIFTRIILPLVRPISAVIVIWTLVASWNEYLLPLMFLQKPGLQTVPLLPQFYMGEYGNDEGKIIAAAVVGLLPEILAYVIAQRWFERGLTAGALK